MMRLVSKVREPQNRAEPQASVHDVYPLPIVFLAAVALFLGDVAVAVTAVTAIG